MFFSIQLFNTVDSKYYYRWLDLNLGSLLLEETALPTVPQPLTSSYIFLSTFSSTLPMYKCNIFIIILLHSVTRQKSPNIYNSSPKMISLEKWMILTPLQKLPNNVADLGKIIVATGFKWSPKLKKSPNLVTLFTSMLRLNVR